MKKDKNKFFWIMIGIGVMIIILLMIIGNIITIGEKIYKINKYVSYLFYTICILIVYFLLVNPIRIILFSPTFSIPAINKTNKRKTKKIYKKVAKNIISNKNISEESIKKLKNSIIENRLNEEINHIYNNEIKKEIHKIIMKNAKTVMISTAISQNGKFDMFTVLSINLKMIKEIVEMCGFRPSYQNLGKLSLNVLGTALISEGLENVDFSELFPNLSTSVLGELPFLKVITGSVIQGITNAFLTLRIGIITRKFLFCETPIKSKTKIRIDAFKESTKMLPSVIKNGLVIFPEKIRKVFSKKEHEYNEEV